MTLSTGRPPERSEDRIYRRVTGRLIPFLMLCYVVAYLDRVNVGFARLQMLRDLRFSETVYGLGAGVFFLGYFLFEVPSNLILHRVGARAWIARIMITWGIISGACLWITTPAMFYLLRFLLGVAEAGFYPGIILYLTRYYPAERRARVIALFMSAIPLSGVFGSPLSGWIMESFNGSGGWAGWQWMFLLEAIPAVLLGLAVFFYLSDDIRSTRWLDEEEKKILEKNIDRDSAGMKAHASLFALFRDGRIWSMSAIYFCCVMGQYGLTLWMPTLIQAAGAVSLLHIGMLTAIPYIAAVLAMILLGQSADRRRERRYHLALPMLFGAAGLMASVWAGDRTGLAVLCLSVAAGGILSSAPLFWSLPTSFLRGVSAAAGIAAINSVGNLAGFASPYLMGWLKDLTGNTAAGMYILAAILTAGALAVLRIPVRQVNR